MESEQIKYSDFIQDDGAIKEAIAQLTLLQDAFETLMDTVKSYAKETAASLKNISGATEEGRGATRRASDDASKLEKAQRELAFAYTDTAAKIAELKLQLADKNKELKNEAAFVIYSTTAYKELKAELDLNVEAYRKLTKEEALNSSKGAALIANILALKKELRAFDDATKLSTKSLSANTNATKQQTAAVSDLDKAKAKLQKAMSAENAMLIELSLQTKEANTVAKLNAIIAREQEGSYNRLSAQYALNKIALNKMTEAERTTTVSGMAFVKQTDEIYASMIRLQEATGNHTLSVGNYKKAWDGIGMGVNQVIRELPVVGISLNTFFLGISNNIPILIDEIKKVQEANKVAFAAGEKTTNIYKKLIMSVFSWNTALVVAMTIFAMYGKQILSAVFGIEEAVKAVDRLKIAEEYLGEARNAGRKGAQEELVRLKLLYSVTQNAVRPMNERLEAAQELRKLYPKYLKFLSDEAILAGQASDAYIFLAGSILKAAKSRAFEEKITENEKERIDLNDKRIGQLALEVLKNKEIAATQHEINKAKVENQSDSGEIAGAFQGTFEESLRDQNKELKDIQKEYERINTQIKEIDKANERLAAGIDVTDLKLTKDPKAKKDPNGPKDRTEEIMKANLEIRKKYAESVTALEDDELFKQQQALKDTYEAESALLMNKYKYDKDLTEESRGLILQIIKNWGIDMVNEYGNINTEIAIRQLTLAADTLQAQLDMTEEGSAEEAEARLKIMENSRKLELLNNSKLTELQRQDEALINEKWDILIDRERNKSIYDMGMEQLRLQQEFDESEFDLLRRTEEEKTKFKLQQEKQRWAAMLEYAKAGNLKLSDLEIKTLENLIKKIDQDMQLGKKFDFYSMFGLKPTDEERQAVQSIISNTMGYLKDALASEIELADITIAKAQERVDVKQQALNDEIEMRNAGYAFNVTQAQKELDAEKAMLDKANKEKQKLAKAQERLNTASQASNLITASAGIWSSFAPLGPLGVALAIAGIATMFGSFALAKVKANQVAKAQTYGEGGFEILHGGSHASGNDVGIGNMPDGRQRRAEGGEGLAIIAKDKMQKYKGLVPAVINSINKGIFERQYGRTFAVNPPTNVFDMSFGSDKLENDVSEIKKQGERKIVFNSKGQRIEYYKNLKTTYNS